MWTLFFSFVAIASLPGSADDELSFLECEGNDFDPAWLEFKNELNARLGRGNSPGEALANRAIDLLESADAEGDNLGYRVAAFSALLRGEAEAIHALGNFCLYGLVAAYACIALHLRNTTWDDSLAPTAKSSVARAVLVLAKKVANDFLESTRWPIRSMDLMALITGDDVAEIRALETQFNLPCHFALGCPYTRLAAESENSPPMPPLSVAWPEKIAAIGMHITSTLEVVTAFRDAMNEAWGRGGAGTSKFDVQYAGHPCPTHEGSEHQCAMKCEMFGMCGAGAEASDPLADFIAGAVDVAKYQEREVYKLEEARAALRWVPRKLAPLRDADMFVCTFPTVLCVLMHEMFPKTPMLFVAIANPLFAAPGCSMVEDSTVRDCETEDAREFLRALRSMLQEPGVQGIAAYSVTTALVGFQTGIKMRLAGKAGRYLPPTASWNLRHPTQVLVARSRFFETILGQNLRNMISMFKQKLQAPLEFLLQQDIGSYMSYEDIASFRGVVILPQDLGLHKFTEHYAMSMPIWMPSREWAYRMQLFVPWGMVAYSGSWQKVHDRDEDDSDAVVAATRTLRSLNEDWDNLMSPDLCFPPWFNAQTVPYRVSKVAFWYEFSEFVAYPGVQTFSSVPDLFKGTSAADLEAISGRMRHYRAELWQTTRAVYAAAASHLAAFAVAAVDSAEPE